MALYRRPRNTRVLVVSLVMVSLLTITMDYRGGQAGPLASAGRAAFTVVGGIQDGLSTVFRPIGAFVSGVAHVGSLQSENARLKEEIRRLQEQAAQDVSVLRELEILKSLADLQARGELRGPVARVIGQSVSNFEWSINVDRGSADGVELNDPVVSGDAGGALVGKVIEVTSNWSKVLLVIDPDSKVGGRLASSGETGVVEGQTDRQDLTMDIFSDDVKVFPDEVVETSGADGGSLFPAGIVIGYVTLKSDEPAALLTTIRVRPAVEVSALEYVLVVTGSARSSTSPPD